MRDLFPRRRVVRVVQGVEMTLPWSHRLPDYAAGDSPYGQNLVELARLITPSDGPLVVIDVGANVGDSTLQILAATDARVVCVEADEFYLDFLATNVGDDERCRIEASLLTPDATATAHVSAVRTGGTTRFVADDATEAGLPQVTPEELRRRHPWTEQLRLVKSDTDGYDVALVPALAARWQDRQPVLFFEYDLRLSRIAGHDPLAVWDDLAALGYTEVAIWGHGGDAVGRAPVSAMRAASARLDEPEMTRQRAYWDVAVVHGDDAAGLAALEQLVPEQL